MFSASVGEQIIGSPRRLSEVLSTTPLPVSFSSLQHQVVVARVELALEHLGARGAVFVHDFRHARLPFLGDFEGEGHERCGVIAAEHLRPDGIEHARDRKAASVRGT